MSEKTGIAISSNGDFSIIVFEEESIDSTEKITAAALKIYEHIEKQRPRRLIVDFGRVKFFSSEVLGVLLNIRSKLKGYGAEAVISGINPQLYRVFRITNINRLFRFFEDIESAKNEISKNE